MKASARQTWTWHSLGAEEDTTALSLPSEAMWAWPSSGVDSGGGSARTSEEVLIWPALGTEEDKKLSPCMKWKEGRGHGQPLDLERGLGLESLPERE